MSITDELREIAAKTECANGRCEKLYRGDLDHIADRIDEAHERVCKEQYACGVEHGIGASIEASMIQEHGFIELPKDADGVPICVGDVMETEDNRIRKVDALQLSSRKWSIGLVTTDCAFSWHDADRLRHHHALTVEDVLREFAEKVIDSQIPSVHPTYEEAIAEYTARLALREVDE